MLQIWFILLLLKTLTAVNAFAVAPVTPTLTWTPLFPYETEQCPQPSQWVDSCHYPLGERAMQHEYPDVLKFEYKNIFHLSGTPDLYEVMIEFQIDQAHTYTTYELKEISFQNLTTPDDYLPEEQFAYQLDLTESVEDSPYHFFVKWVMKIETHDMERCTTPFKIKYLWERRVQNISKREEIEAYYYHVCGANGEEGDYPVQCWAPCDGDADETYGDPSTIEMLTTGLPEPTNCPTVFSPEVCDFPFGSMSNDRGFPALEVFEFKSIRSVGSDSYEVMLEFQIDGRNLRKQNLVEINILDLHSPGNYLDGIVYIYLRDSIDFVGDSPYHFFFKFITEAQEERKGLLCSAPFQIVYRWDTGDEGYYEHGCPGHRHADYPMQCWKDECYDKPEPTTVVLTKSDLPEPTECPGDTFRQSLCMNNPDRASQMNYPELLTFRFESIKYIDDELYEVMFEFEIDSRERPRENLQSVYVKELQSNGMLEEFMIWERNSDNNLAGDSPFHFYFIYTMTSQEIGLRTCTTPFTIHYDWDGFEAFYTHGCGEDSALECWDSFSCNPVPVPETIITTKDDMPPPTQCPSTFSPLVSDVPLGENARYNGYPEVLKFDFHSIEWVNGDHYEVMIEFEIERSIPKRDLLRLTIHQLGMPDGYMPGNIALFDINGDNLVGDSPYHFFFKWVTATEPYEGIGTCTKPFMIEYIWTRSVAWYIHGGPPTFDMVDSSLQCWEMCQELAGEPVSIISTDPNLPEPTECPTVFRESCELVTMEETPEIFNFVYIHYIEDNLYEVMLELKTDGLGHRIHDIQEIKMIPMDEFNQAITIYDRDSGDQPAGDSPYHFYLVWTMRVAYERNQICTTPFYIKYQWTNDYVEFHSGCNSGSDHYPSQCWIEKCFSDPDPATIIPEMPVLPEPTECPQFWEPRYCQFPTGLNAHMFGHPEVLAFNFESIKHLEENLYEVQFEFHIETLFFPKHKLESVHIEDAQAVDGFLTRDFVIWDKNSDDNPAGDSPFHFYFVFIMESQEIQDYICTTPFNIHYFWDGYNALYTHDCNYGDSPLQCWDPICDPDPEPSTIVSVKDDMPAPTQCPSQFGPGDCHVAVGDGSWRIGFPKLLTFELLTIKWITDIYYEVMFEFEIERTMPRRELFKVSIRGLETGGEDFDFFDIFAKTDLLGSSPYHFVLKTVIPSIHFSGRTCTSPFSILYQWANSRAEYFHGCTSYIDWIDSPMQCWDEVCQEEVGEPRTIISTDPNYPEATECPTTFSKYCEPTGAVETPEIFNFVYIHHIQDDLYEVMLEFKTDGFGHATQEVKLIQMLPADNFDKSITLYNRDTGESPAGDSPYHFFLVWTMQATPELDYRSCTTPFFITYEWTNDFKEFGCGCNLESDHYGLQCWEDICNPEPTGDPATIINVETTFPPSIQCPPSFEDKEGCSIPGKSNLVETFEFIHIRSIQDDLYEVMLEFKLDPREVGRRKSDIRYIKVVDLLGKDNTLEEILLYDYNGIDQVGDSPYHFFLSWVMKATEESITCTTPFFIEYYWSDYSRTFEHGCGYVGQYALQCWDSICPPEIIGDPSTIVSTKDDFGPPTDCPAHFDSLKCKFEVGESSRHNDIPEVKKFDFFSIEWIQDSYYEVMMEFEIEDTIRTRKLQRMYLDGLNAPDQYLGLEVELYNRFDETPAGSSPYHFFFKWVMTTEMIDNYFCTTPFYVRYIWDEVRADYGHGCDGDMLDSPLQCWKEYCEPEPTGDPLTIINIEPTFPPSIECPAWYEDFCTVEGNGNIPEIFQFVHIRSIENDLYEVMLEFKMDGMGRRKSDIKNIRIMDLLREDNSYESIILYDHGGDQVGDSPYHFFLSWVMKAESDYKRACTSPFYIQYEWNDFDPMTFGHGCYSSDQYPKQCWDNICQPEIHGEPSMIASTRDDLNHPTDCPKHFDSIDCGFPIGDSSRRNGFPEVFKFDFVSIEWVKDSYYEVMMEFEIADTIRSNKLQSIYLEGLQTPDDYLLRPSLFIRGSLEHLVGDSPYHFFFKWVMNTERQGRAFCTTPFHVIYEWESNTADYGYGCDGYNLDSPHQCWEEYCAPEPTGEPSTIITIDRWLPPATDCPSVRTDYCDVAHSGGSEIFNFVRINHVEDDLYVVMLEFKLTSTRPKYDLSYITVSGILGDSRDLYLYNYDGLDEVGYSPYHFFLSWVMEAESDGWQTCTTPFTIEYNWGGITEKFSHGCNYYDDAYPYQCWKERCNLGPEPSSIIPDMPDLPIPTTVCPEIWESDRICEFKSDWYARDPRVLEFKFESIKHVDEEFYEVTFEFEIDRRPYPISTLQYVRITSHESAFGYLAQGVVIWDRLVGNSLAGDSPFHFYFTFLMKSQELNGFICTTPFTIEYVWDDYQNTYSHGCGGYGSYIDGDSQLQCWDMSCDIIPKPSIIVTTRDDMPLPTQCPLSFGPSVCNTPLGQSSRYNGYPEVLKFDFVSIEWVSEYYYEVMIEFEIERTISKRDLRRVVFLSDLATPNEYLPSEFDLYNVYGVNLTGNSPYHFFFKWVMTASPHYHGRTCTNPFHIEYQWDIQSATYGHGCSPEVSFGDSPLQCWEEICYEPEEPTSELDEETTLTEEETTEIESETTEAEYETTEIEEYTTEIEEETSEFEGTEVEEETSEFETTAILEDTTEIEEDSTEVEENPSESNENSTEFEEESTEFENHTTEETEETTDVEEDTSEIEQQTTSTVEETTEADDETTRVDHDTIETDEETSTTDYSNTTEYESKTSTEPGRNSTHAGVPKPPVDESTTELEDSSIESDTWVTQPAPAISGPVEDNSSDSNEGTVDLTTEPTTDAVDETTSDEEYELTTSEQEQISTKSEEETAINPAETTTEETASDPAETVTDSEDTVSDPLETATDPGETTTDREETSEAYETTSDHEETTDAEDTTADPDETTPDPEETTSDPEETTSDPEKTTSDPEETTSDPDETTTDVEETSTDPEKTTDVNETSTDPTETTTDVEETTSDSEETSTDQEETASDHEESSIVAEETTNAEETTDPEEASTDPKDTASYTEDTTTDPSETTTDPEETTDAEETSSDPRETISDPEENTDAEETTIAPEENTTDPGESTSITEETPSITDEISTSDQSEITTGLNDDTTEPEYGITSSQYEETARGIETVNTDNPEEESSTTSIEPMIEDSTLEYTQTSNVLSAPRTRTVTKTVTTTGEDPTTTRILTETVTIDTVLPSSRTTPLTGTVTTVVADPGNPTNSITLTLTLTPTVSNPSNPTSSLPNSSTGSAGTETIINTTNPSTVLSNPSVVVTTIANADFTYVSTITYLSVPSVPTGSQPGGNISNSNGSTDITEEEDIEVPSYGVNPNGSVVNPDEEEELQISPSGVANPDQEEELQVSSSGGNPSDANSNPNVASNPASDQEEQLQVPNYDGDTNSPVNPNDSTGNSDQIQEEQLQVPSSGDNANNPANANGLGNPNDPSLNPEEDELLQNPNVLLYTSAVPTTIISDGTTYETSIPMVYSTTVSDSTPEVMIATSAPVPGSAGDSIDADPNLEELLEEFEGSASGLHCNVFMLCLCLISTMVFV
ncbi:Lysostaphin [Spathaspora sp. JA1]|nr:Lysostaphin [Spathaspora sp. JA1]